MDSELFPNSTGGEAEGVLLYYKFVTIPDTDAVRKWFLLCSRKLSLVGRIRVARNGINATVGGKMAALRSHTEVVATHPLFGDIDFKLALCGKPVDRQVAAECGFDTLSVRLVAEVVSLGLHHSLQQPSIFNAGLHVSPTQFNTILHDAARSSLGKDAMLETHTTVQHTRDSGSHQAAPEFFSSGIVMLDARNIYETSIGKFCPPPGVPFFDPKIRQYSALPKWMDQNEDQLRGKQILMYCTGGIRCEMASAYLRSKGEGFQDVLQLSGGIQRYLEVFPDGGFFKGKNFVFDHRISVPSLDSGILGSCLVCAAVFDDYSTRMRCSLCRMLILVCNDCRKLSSLGVQYVCSLCQTHKVGTGTPTISPSEHERIGGEFTCNEPVEPVPSPTNAPWPFPDRKVVSGGDSTSLQRQKLRVLCLHGFRQSASSLKGRTASLRKKLKAIASFTFIDAPHALQVSCRRPSPDGNCAPNHADAYPLARGRKYAWLVSPDSMESATSATCQALGDPVPGLGQPILFDPMQHRTQTSGWDTSWNFIQKVFKEQGPFDGVLGFSQGAAVAAALCPLRCTDSQKMVNFKFVICCSGFPSPAPEHFAMSPATNPSDLFECPSLHVFGGRDGEDRQISSSESEQLASFFVPASSVVVRHEFGHLIPARRAYIQSYKDFLTQF